MENQKRKMTKGWKIAGLAVILIFAFTFLLPLIGADKEEKPKVLSEQDGKENQIDNNSVLENYKKVKKVESDYLYENASEYKGKNIMSVAIVGEVDDKELKLKTKKTKDDLFFSFILDCNNTSDLEKLEEEKKVCFVGKVENKSSIGGCVNIHDCEIVAYGNSVSKYEKQLKKGEKKRNKKRKKLNEKKLYMEKCKAYQYSAIKRNPDKYDGKKVKVSGKVIQIDEGWLDSVTMRIEDSNKNDWYTTYSYSDGERKILENDKITIYGECTGTEQYETILGDTRRIPSIEAKYIK